MRAVDVTAVAARLRGRVGIGVAALIFCAATTLTIVICASMSSRGGMPMPGGWTMSMAWARMCGQTWSGAAAAFLGMWTAMMVAMMLPVLMSALWRYRPATEEAGNTRLTVLASAGYFAVWIASGAVLYPLGVALAALEMRFPAVARAVPLATGLTVLMAGAYQLSALKARYLVCCRAAAAPCPGSRCPAGVALRHGLRLGLHCSGCCAGLTATMLAIGVMDLRAMAFSAVAIAAERFARNGGRGARLIGMAVLGLGFVLIARAAVGLQLQ